jgi:hypothetical protein
LAELAQDTQLEFEKLGAVFEEIAKELANVHSPIGIPATEEFPRSTFLIVPIVDLFKYSFDTKDHLKQSVARSLN